MLWNIADPAAAQPIGPPLTGHTGQVTIERSHLRGDLFFGFDRYDFGVESLCRVLVEEYGCSFEAGEQVIRAGIVRDADAETLSIPDGDPVLELVRTSVSRGTVVEWTTSTYPASRFELLDSDRSRHSSGICAEKRSTSARLNSSLPAMLALLHRAASGASS